MESQCFCCTILPLWHYHKLGVMVVAVTASVVLIWAIVVLLEVEGSWWSIQWFLFPRAKLMLITTSPQKSVWTQIQDRLWHGSVFWSISGVSFFFPPILGKYSFGFHTLIYLDYFVFKNWYSTVWIRWKAVQIQAEHSWGRVPSKHACVRAAFGVCQALP